MYRCRSTLPERFEINSKVTLIQGNVLNPKDCEAVVQDVDAVCITLGTRNQLDATTDLSVGTSNIIKAMKLANVKRFSIVMSSFLFRPISEVPNVFHPLNEEHQRMLDLAKTSDLDYVAILPPHISDEDATEYMVTHDASPSESRIVSKYDLAKFIVDCLEQPEHFRQTCGICKKPS